MRCRRVRRFKGRIKRLIVQDPFRALDHVRCKRVFCQETQGQRIGLSHSLSRFCSATCARTHVRAISDDAGKKAKKKIINNKPIYTMCKRNYIIKSEGDKTKKRFVFSSMVKENNDNN